MNFMNIANLAASLMLLATASVVHAQGTGGPGALYVRSLAASCANCHGTDGKAVQGSTVPGLAGLEKGYIVAQMNAFKTGTRPSTVMQQLAKGFNDAQVESLAGYFAAQKK